MELVLKVLLCVMVKGVLCKKSILHIGGFIEVNTTNKGWNSAGIQPAINLAVRQINNRSDILPNHTLLIHWRDTKVISCNTQRTESYRFPVLGSNFNKLKQ